MLDIIVAGRVAGLKREYNDRAWLAWHVAALQRAKKMPKLEKMMLRASMKPSQTMQEQIAIMDRWVAVTSKIEKAKGK